MVFDFKSGIIERISIQVNDKLFYINIDKEFDLIIGTFKDKYFYNMKEVGDSFFLHFDKEDNSLCGFTIMDSKKFLEDLKKLLESKNESSSRS